MPVVAALINHALESGVLFAAQTHTGISLMVKVWGVGIQIAHIEQEEATAMMRPKLVSVE